MLQTPAASRPLNNGALHLNFGLDIRLTDSLDLRAPDHAGAQAGFFNGALVLHLRPRS